MGIFYFISYITLFCFIYAAWAGVIRFLEAPKYPDSPFGDPSDRREDEQDQREIRELEEQIADLEERIRRGPSPPTPPRV